MLEKTLLTMMQRVEAKKKKSSSHQMECQNGMTLLGYYQAQTFTTQGIENRKRQHTRSAGK